jgi:hypothetical protein
MKNGVLIVTVLLFAQCSSRNSLNPCNEPVGRWTDQEGTEWVFEPNGKAMLLHKFGSQYDTQFCQYQYDCNTEPVQINLANFSSGPYRSKLLQGIFEWSSDSSFRLQYSTANRPKVFDAEATEKFYRFKVDCDN